MVVFEQRNCKGCFGIGTVSGRKKFFLCGVRVISTCSECKGDQRILYVRVDGVFMTETAFNASYAGKVYQEGKRTNEVVEILDGLAPIERELRAIRSDYQAVRSDKALISEFPEIPDLSRPWN